LLSEFSVTSCFCSEDLDESAAIIMLGRVFGRPKAEPSALSSLDKLNEVSSPFSLSVSVSVSVSVPLFQSSLARVLFFGKYLLTCCPLVRG
jgi:hypothetical protein